MPPAAKTGPAAGPSRRRFATALLGGLLAIVLGALPADAGAENSTDVRSPPDKSPTGKSYSGADGGLKGSAGYPKGGLSAADARKGFKPSFGAKPYRYFGRHGYGKAGISRFGQGSRRD